MKKTRELFAAALAICIFVGVTYSAGRLLLPVRTVFGAAWGQYLQEEADSLDVLYFGSSVVYCDVVPAVVWKESGLTSYVMAGPEQTLPVTYHYIRQAVKTQSPQAVVVELNGLFFDRYPELMKPNLLYMPWGVDRVRATLKGADPKDRLELLFPLCSSHDRVYSVTTQELRENLFPVRDDYAGYTPLTVKTPLPWRTDVSFDANTEAYREGIRYLGRIADLCEKRGIRLVLFFAPLYCNIPQDALDALYRDVAEIPCAGFFDCNAGGWPAFDPMEQWFDCAHLNLYGAEPFSRRLAEELRGLGLESAHGNSRLWQKRYDLFMGKLAGGEDG